MIKTETSESNNIEHIERGEWRTIEEFPNYEVSDKGKIRSWYSNKKKVPELVGGYPDKDGYLRVALFKNKNRYYRGIHRIVAKTFIPNPNNYPLALHKDDDVENNNVSNIYWGTPKDNMADRRINSHMNEGENCGTSKLTRKEVLEIRGRFKSENITARDLSKDYPVAYCTIRRIINRSTWKHI